MNGIRRKPAMQTKMQMKPKSTEMKNSRCNIIPLRPAPAKFRYANNLINEKKNQTISP